MGLFGFFKKQNTNETTNNSKTSMSDLFLSTSKYNEYIVRFIAMQQQGGYAPISAYENLNGEIIGFLYTIGEDKSYSLSAEEAIKKMEERFESKIANHEIKSYVIIYHSQFQNDNNHKIANSDDELKAISVSYNFINGQKDKIGLPYKFNNDEVTYQGFTNFSAEENNIIFNTKTKEGKEYFQEREEIKAPIFENEIGIKIKKSNSNDLNNTWCGILGFESYSKPNGSDILNEYFDWALTQKPIVAKNNLFISQIDFKDISFKAVTLNRHQNTILPVIKTDYIVDVESREIDEWENVDNIEAIVSGRGRDTFGVWYFATDYAENRNRYLTEKKLNIKISGIAFDLDIYNNDQKESDVKFSDDFTTYMPNKDLPNYACFDFIGQLEDFKETTLLKDNSLKGYILKVRLITYDIKDFFTIDIYVTQENMRFTGLTKGMKLTGMFQMQGQIAN